MTLFFTDPCGCTLSVLDFSCTAVGSIFKRDRLHLLFMPMVPVVNMACLFIVVDVVILMEENFLESLL